MKQFVNLRLAFFVAISLCLGIGFIGALKLYSITSGVIVGACFIVILVVFICLFLSRIGVKTTITFALIFLLFFSLGTVLTSVQINNYEKANLNAHSYKITAKVEEVSPTDLGSRLILSNAYVEGDFKGELNYKISLYVNGESDFEIGDKISLFAKLKDKQLVYSNRVLSEDISGGIKYSASISAKDITLLEKDKTIFHSVNTFIKDSLYDGLDENEFSIAYAMLLGNSDYMDEQVLSSYRSAGVAHIFAVSGLHIGFLSVALNFILNKLGAKRWVKALVIIPTLFFYSGVCGFTASSLRASIMSAVMLLLSIKGERYDGISSISIAAIIILLFNPMDMFCVGFILSFSIVLGILVFSRPISKIFKFLPQKLANTLGMILSAQLVGAPIMLMFFGQFSLISIIANLLFIPIISVVFVVILLFAVLGGIFSISGIVLFLPNYILKGINLLIICIDTKSLMIGGFSLFGFVVFYYLALLICSGLINLKSITKLILALICSIICITGSIFCNIAYNRQIRLYIIGSANLSAVVVCEKDVNTLILSDANGAFSLSRLKSLYNSNEIDTIDNLVFCAENKDYQSVITRLNVLAKIERVYYYGQKDEMAEKVVCKSFPVIEMINLVENSSVGIGNISLSYFADGDGCVIDGQKDYLILSKTNVKNIDLKSLDEKYEKVITLENVEWLSSILSRDKLISFRSNATYEDGETFGNFSFVLD